MGKTVFTTEDLLEIIRLTKQDKISSRKIGELYNVGKSTIGDFLREETYSEFWEEYNKRPHLAGTKHNQLEHRKTLEGTKFVITSAQNNTYVHGDFLKSLENYCEHNDAELLVSTFVYDRKGWKNGEKGVDASDNNYWYDPKIEKYRCDDSVQLAEGLVLCGELNIIPTAVNPASGLQNYLGSQSGIIPHAKLQLESLPSPKGEDARLMYTTGAVTQRNYIKKKEGQKASWHHCFSAVVVEIDSDGDWFVRQLHAEQETGNFYDLTKYYTPEGVEEHDRIEAINYGDIHAAKLDDVVADVSWRNKDSILDILKPKYQLVHDVLDQRARNHHNVKDPHFMFEMFNNKTESVEEEVLHTAGVLDSMCRDYSEVIVVESNHDLALRKWLKEQDYRKDPVNALFFLELQLMEYRAIANNDKEYSTFKDATFKVMPELRGKSIKFLGTDESFKVKDIECGSHGHLGCNGGRPSTASFRMQGIKFNTGHSHSPTIKDGVYTAGVSGKLDMSYNTGSSSWGQAHILTYNNGKRTIVAVKNGKWRS